MQDDVGHDGVSSTAGGSTHGGCTYGDSSHGRCVEYICGGGYRYDSDYGGGYVENGDLRVQGDENEFGTPGDCGSRISPPPRELGQFDPCP